LSLVGFSGVFFGGFFFGWFFVSFSLWFRAEFELLVCSCDVGPACTWVAVGAEFCPCRAIDPGRMGTPGGRCQGGWCLSDPLLHLICPGSVSDGLLLAMTVCRDTRVSTHVLLRARGVFRVTAFSRWLYAERGGPCFSGQGIDAAVSTADSSVPKAFWFRQ
jgi:hypothetical protein